MTGLRTDDVQGLRKVTELPPIIETPQTQATATTTMTLEDFEKQLAEEKQAEQSSRSDRHHRHREHRHDDDHRHKRRRHSHDEDREHRRHRHRSRSREHREHKKRHRHHETHRDRSRSPQADVTEAAAPTANEMKRDSWMQAPSALDVEYKTREPPPEPVTTQSKKADFELKIHENELNKHHLQDMRDGKQDLHTPSEHEVNYTFGDTGSEWRMIKLRNVYRKAGETGETVEDVAMKQYGDLRAFDDAREEEIEMERRKTYGDGYVGKQKPSGELFQERKLDIGATRNQEPEPEATVEPKRMPIDQSSLNKLRAKMMKAKLRGGPDAEALEVEYNTASAALDAGENVVVLGTMENRLLAGGREGEVKAIDNKRGRERGLVEENDDMTIEDMVREERRTRGQGGGEGKKFAERIAKDGKFDNDLDYMDENASKLAKRVHKSEINLRNAAVEDFQKMNRILDNCPLCHHEDTDTPPVAPVVSLATRVYLTLTTEPEISAGGGVIVPIQHRTNLLECDDDEWEEIRNFMKSLTRMYDSRSMSVLFYENAAYPHLHQHAALNVVPLPKKIGPTAPGFFREAILAADAEWSQHKKLIDTAKGAETKGRKAFRMMLAKEMPYFHVWFTLDGGLGHIVEDGPKWPKGDGFAREVLGGMLSKDLAIIRARGRWTRGDARVESFRKIWNDWDWTQMLLSS